MRAGLLGPVVALALAGCSGFETADMGSPDMGPSLLAGGLVLPMSLGVNDRQVYWLEFGPQNQGLCGMLSRVDKHTGCAQADGGCIDLLTDMRFLVVSLVLTPSDVCWLEYYDAMREVHCMSIATAQIRKLADNQPYAYSLFTDNANLYWVNGGSTGSVQTTPIGPTQAPATTLASGLRMPTTVAVDDAALYWGEDRGSGGVVVAAGRGGESPKTIAGNLSLPQAVRPFGDYVYFTEAKGGKVERAHKDGSGVEVIADGELSPIDLAVDASGVYWLSQGTPPNYLDGQIARADLDGKNKKVIAADQKYPYALAIDDEAVYWIVEGTEGANYLDGALYRAPK